MRIFKSILLIAGSLVLLLTFFFGYIFFSFKSYYDRYNIPCIGKKAYTTIKDALQMPKEVCELRLESLNLISAPPELKEFINLRILSLANNNLNYFPSEIIQLRELTYLNVSNNNLKTIPSEIGQMKNISRLELRNINISSLPREMVNLQNLNFLDLSQNNFTREPNVLSEIRNDRNKRGFMEMIIKGHAPPAINLLDNPIAPSQ